MSNSKIPVEVRRHFTAKDNGGDWTLTCDVCKEQWRLQKPQKGRKLHGGNVLHLLEHAASHPLPKEEDEVENVVAASPTPEPSSEPIVELAPVSQVNETPHHKPLRYSYPTPKEPNAYRVEVHGNITKVKHFRDQTYTKYRQVERGDNCFAVVIFAANTKHAGLIGERIIEDAIKEK